MSTFEGYYGLLALSFCEGVQPQWCREINWEPRELFEAVQTPKGRAAVSDQLARRVGSFDDRRFDGTLEALQRIDACGVSMIEPTYPSAFLEAAQPPPVVFYRGNLELLHQRGVAIVGTRTPSAGGSALARTLGRDLSVAGINVISGMARGIDTAAHRGALQGVCAGTAVVGTGLDVPYPEDNAELMLELATRGCVVTEQLPGTLPTRDVFPRRNRLISALSRGVVVVEGGVKSGALITARWALEQGRDVGAVPGFPGDYRSSGPNQLIRDGAFVVESAADILHAVGFVGVGAPVSDAPAGSGADASDPVATDSIEGRVHAAMSRQPIDADGLSAATGIPVSDVMRALGALEIAGTVKTDAGGRYTRT